MINRKINKLSNNCLAALVALCVSLAMTGCGMEQSKRRSTSVDAHIVLSSGTLLGAASNGIKSFKGIPYAAAPIGALRWKEPQSVPAWEGTRDVTHYGAKCWAAAAFGGPVETSNVSEDCLFLNVWTSANTKAQKLPVMVWIHGGGYQFGTASTDALDGTHLAEKGVVIVTFNYRLGVLGFLTRPDLDAESNGHRSGMYGLLDQVAALRWVKENIAEFGGDPDNVTVFGESAGAHSVGLLMASPLGKGLFQKAIGESGAFWESENGTMRSHADGLAKGTAFGTTLGKPTLAELRSISAKTVQKSTNWTLATDPSVTSFSPTVDGYVLPESPYDRFRQGRQNDVPLLAGWNSDEGALFSNRALPHSSEEEFINAATAKFNQVGMDQFSHFYPAKSAAQAAQSARTLIGDQVIKQQVWAWLMLQRRTGHSPVYAYEFEHVSKYNPIATHTTEVPYVFGNFPNKPSGPPSADDLALSKLIESYWTNFAEKADPNGKDLPQWPQYERVGVATLHLSNATHAGMQEGDDRLEYLNMLRPTDK